MHRSFSMAVMTLAGGPTALLFGHPGLKPSGISERCSWVQSIALIFFVNTKRLTIKIKFYSMKNISNLFLKQTYLEPHSENRDENLNLGTYLRT